MWWLSYKEIQKVLRESEEDYLRHFKSLDDHESKGYNRDGIFVTREIRKKLYEAMKKKYDNS